MIFDGKVIVVCDGMNKQYIAALDLETGKEIWKTNRPPMKADSGEFRKAYCTPIQIEVDGKKQLVIPGAQWIAAYAPEDGKEIWRAKHGTGFSVTPMPVYESGLVIFSTGYMRPELVAIDPTGTGDVTESKVIWRTPGATTMPSLIAKDGQVKTCPSLAIRLGIVVAPGVRQMTLDSVTSPVPVGSMATSSGRM